jgi:flagellar basal-body rod modification protein FlgD
MTVSAVATTTAANSTASVNTFSSIESNEFMQLLLVQLKYQDPLEPMDSNEIMGQITQLNSLQELQAINGGIEGLAENNELVEAASLLEKMVSYTTDDGLVKIGFVEGITRSGSETRLLIGEDAVALDNVLSIQPAAEEG